MLSAEDIKNVSFRRANFGGYKPEDVDAFVDDLQVSYDKILQEREQLLNQVDELNKKLEHYRGEDDAIRKILSKTQNIVEESLNDAKNKSSNIISEATVTAKTMITEAENEVSMQKEISKRLKDESEKLKNELNDIYKKHMEIIDKIPGELLDESHSKREFEDIPSDVDDDNEVFSQECVSENTGKEDIYSDFQVSDDASKLKDDFEEKYKNLAFGTSYDRSVFDDNNSGAYYGIFRKE